MTFAQITTETIDWLNKLGGPVAVVAGVFAIVAWQSIKGHITAVEKRCDALEKRCDECEADRSALRNTIIEKLSRLIPDQESSFRVSRRDNDS